MLNDEELLAKLRNLKNQPLAALALLSHVKQPAKTSIVRDKGIEIGYRYIKKWNLSDVLRRASARGLVAQLPAGWKLLGPGVTALRDAGVDLDVPIVSETRHGLRKYIDTFADEERRRFLEEATGCFEAGYHRGAIVLSWVGAMSIMQEHIVSAHVAAFNSAGSTRFPKTFKPIRGIKDFGSIKEADVLQLCEDAGIVDKAEKAELQARLDLRNRCGHPNSLRIAEHTVGHHLEILTLNVYNKY